MWINRETEQAVDRVARIYYHDAAFVKAWNAGRRDGELRMMTGWMWVSKENPQVFQRSLKSQTAAYIAAYYALVTKQRQPIDRIRRVA